MATNDKYGKGEYHTGAEIDDIEGATCLSKTHSQWRKNKLYTRNNFGKVYNYFCPMTVLSHYLTCRVLAGEAYLTTLRVV